MPAGFSTSYALVATQINTLLEYMKDRLANELKELPSVSVTGRIKSPESALEKLHTGKYAKFSELKDVVALTVVVMHQSEVPKAMAIIRNTNFAITEELNETYDPTDFRYRESKLFLQPPQDYLDRNVGFRNIICEVQFTTTLQNALNKTTHDFDYKGSTYSWGNFRLVAQFRGTLELLDKIIDDIEKASLTDDNDLAAHPQLLFAASILKIIKNHFSMDILPSDCRRLADTVAKWTTAVQILPEDFDELLARQTKLKEALSLDPISAILGSLLTEYHEALLTNYSGRFYISDELVSMCPTARQVPIERRVEVSATFESVQS